MKEEEAVKCLHLLAEQGLVEEGRGHNWRITQQEEPMSSDTAPYSSSTGMLSNIINKEITIL